MKKTWKVMLFLFLTFFPGYAFGLSNWTVMIYMAGDNNLEPYAIQDFLELSSVGSNSNVNIVVELDRAPGYDSSYGNWTKAHRFYVTRGMTPTEDNAISNWGDGNGGREVNMGDPEELKSFVEWAIKNYPANNYILVIWNHGQGWKGKEEKEGNPTLKWVVIDDTESDVLWAYEIKEALQGKHIDVVAMDACLMGTIEIMAELLGIADYFVGSEAEVPADGFPYDDIISALVSDPSMTPRVLCETIVEKYETAYKNGFLPVTLSAVEVNKLSQVIDALNSFTEEVSTTGNWNSIRTLRESVLSFPLQEDFQYQIDLGSFTNDLNLKSKVEDAVFKKYNSQSVSEASGISIYFPQGREYNPFYGDTRRAFTALSSWNDFLKNYLRETAPQINVPMSQSSVEIDGIIDTAEWADAQIIENNGAKIYLKCDEKYLYIAVDDPKDYTLNQDDRIGIYFDTDGDWSWPQSKGNEGNYWVRYNGVSWEGIFRAIWGNSGMPNIAETYETPSSNELSFATSLSTGHLQYELKIDYTLRWNRVSGDEVHLYIFVYDAGKSQDDIRWPEDLTGLDYGHLSPSNYGKIILGERTEIPAIEITPSKLDFGEVKINETKTLTITITNTGTGTLNVEASVGGEDSSAFSITPTTLSVPAGESAELQVSFKPEDDKTYNAYVVIQSNDPSESISYVTLNGEGKEENPLLGGCVASGSGTGLSYLIFLVPIFLVSSLSKKNNKKGPDHYLDIKP
ncbi:MAG: choice-of-anchor D domain-containing protein [Synergistetes bacterium]|nr:MAG: hypothetical protein XD52_0187 [bacterium 42_11]MBC7330961.1 choice-of-anchor D domain-containing protein [Synergistota bacterium]MDK2871471.1 hypothetical protein [bacterium]